MAMVHRLRKTESRRMIASIHRVFLRVFLFWILVTSTQAQGAADLFRDSNKIKPVENPARHTFIYFINGDGKHNSGKTARLDEKDAKDQILYGAETCEACNVVVLHDKRGNDEVSLKVFSRGKEVYSNSIDEINLANPRVLTHLIDFASAYFPTTTLHLHYRGHSLLPNVKKGFDESHPDSPYGPDVLLESLEATQIFKKKNGPILGVVSFAACEMSDLDFFFKLSRFAQYVAFMPYWIDEAAEEGYEYWPFLYHVKDSMETRFVAWWQGKTLLWHIHHSKKLKAYAFDYSTAVVDLEALVCFKEKWSAFWNHLNQETSVADHLEENHQDFESAYPYRRYSQRYAEEKIGRLLPLKELIQEANDPNLRSPLSAPDRKEVVDLVRFLRIIKKKLPFLESGDRLIQEVSELENKIDTIRPYFHYRSKYLPESLEDSGIFFRLSSLKSQVSAVESGTSVE